MGPAGGRGWRRAAGARVCYRVLHAPGAEGYARLVARLLLSDASRAGLRLHEAGEGLGGCDAVLLVAATGGTEEELLAEARGLPRGTPAAALAHPAANSGASLAEVGADLLRLGVPPVQLGPLGAGLEGTLGRLRAVVRGLAAAAALRGSRLGLVGGRAPWLPHTGSELAGALGVEVVEIPAGELLERMPREPPRPPGGLVEGALWVRAGPGALRDALRVYAALKRLAADYGLDALAPGCPAFMGEAGSNACLAMALLNDEGLTVGCEGDVAGTLSLHLAQAAALRAGFLANTAWAGGGRVLLAHCGAPRSMGLAYSIERHVLTGRSPTLAVWFPRGARVTIVKAGYRGSVLVVGEGSIAGGAPWRGRQCESQMLVELPGWGRLGALEAGNHAAAVLGGHSRSVAVAWLSLNPGAPIAPAGEQPWL
jgi:L-fucose isomerase-like protein